MTKVVFLTKNDRLSGFEISGHSTVDSEDLEGKLVCSAISSASIMVANTVTEIIGDDAFVESYDGYLKLVCSSTDKCAEILNGFKLHMEQLKLQFPENIKIKI